MNGNDVADIHAATGAYALDALPPDEREEFERHLEICEACRQEVEEFQEIAAQLAVLSSKVPPRSLRTTVLDAVEPPDASEAVQWATRRLLSARQPSEVRDTVLDLVEQLGGWTVPAEDADERALPLDLGIGSGRPLLPAAEPGSHARSLLERHLPQLVEDARHTLEAIRRDRDRERDEQRR